MWNGFFLPFWNQFIDGDNTFAVLVIGFIAMAIFHAVNYVSMNRWWGEDAG